MQGEEQPAHTSKRNSETSDRQSEFDYEAQFDFDAENHPNRLDVAATCIFEDLDIDNMTNHIKMDTYSGELGNKQQKFIDECHTQWSAYQRWERQGTNQMLFVKQLSTVMGGEAQVVWRRFVKWDEEIEEGEPQGGPPAWGERRRRKKRKSGC